MSDIKALGKDTFIYGIGTVLQRIIGFILLPFYTRALIPAEYGVLDTLATFTFFISTIFSLGLGGATSRYFFIAENEYEQKKLLYTSATLRLISFSVPLLFIVIFSSEISILLFSTEKYSFVLLLTGFVLYFSTQQEIQTSIFRLFREPLKFNVVTIFRAIIYPLTGILFVVVLQWSVLGATLATLITSVISLTFGYFYFVRNKYIRQFSWHWAKKMLNFGYPLIFTSILTWVNSVSDRIFLLHYKDLSEIGLYSIGGSISQPILLINMALSMSSTVIVLSLFNEEKDEDKPKTKSLLTKIWHSYLAVAISIALFISIFSYDIIQILTPSQYIGSILVIPFLLFSQIIYYSVDLTGNGMTLKEQSKPYVWIMLIAAGTNFGLNFYFVPHFGYIGAAITTITSNIIYFILAYYWSQKVFFIKRSFLKPTLYYFITLSIAVFFPFYELKIGGQISYFIKISVLISGLLLPFLLKFIDHSLVIKFFKDLQRRIRL